MIVPKEITGAVEANEAAIGEGAQLRFIGNLLFGPSDAFGMNFGIDFICRRNDFTSSSLPRFLEGVETSATAFGAQGDDRHRLGRRLHHKKKSSV